MIFSQIVLPALSAFPNLSNSSKVLRLHEVLTANFPGKWLN